MIYTAEDVKLLAKCGYLEVAHEGIGAVYAVMHCVVNRIGAPTFPKTLHDVIFQHNAFSWTRPDNPEYGKEPPDDATYKAALEDAEFVLAGDSDPTRGARYYCNTNTMDVGGWFDRNIVQCPEAHPFIIKLGKHSFYR